MRIAKKLAIPLFAIGLIVAIGSVLGYVNDPKVRARELHDCIQQHALYTLAATLAACQRYAN